MILALIILVSICQICLYVVLDKMNLQYGKVITFMIIVIGNLFVFPQFFFPKPDPSGVNCGMPILGITLAFWVIGGGVATLIHIIYYFVRKFIKYKSNKANFPEILDYEEKI